MRGGAHDLEMLILDRTEAIMFWPAIFHGLKQRHKNSKQVWEFKEVVWTSNAQLCLAFKILPSWSNVPASGRNKTLNRKKGVRFSRCVKVKWALLSDIWSLYMRIRRMCLLEAVAKTHEVSKCGWRISGAHVVVWRLCFYLAPEISW